LVEELSMRALLIVMLLLSGVAVSRADDSANLPQSDIDAIGSIVSRQLEAFRHDDGVAAFSFASPNIQGMFGTAEHFMAMVRQGYPPVYRPRNAHIGAVVMRDGKVVQRVDLVGPDGKDELALYTMEKEPDGTWRIDGCQLTAPDTLGV
jgi:hypothetical protein